MLFKYHITNYTLIGGIRLVEFVFNSFDIFWTF